MTLRDEFKWSAARFTRRRFLGTVGAGVVRVAALRIGPLLGVEAAQLATDQGTP